MPDPAPGQITNFEFDAEAELKAQQLADDKLAQMGIRDAEDLGPGRADVGLVSRHLQRIDPDTTAEDMEEAKRRQQWEQEAQAPFPAGSRLSQAIGQPSAEGQPADRLAQLQTELEAKNRELADRNKELGRLQNKFGEERKQVAERLARLEQGRSGYVPPPTAYAQPSVQYDPRILGDVDPNVPLTAAQTAALMQNMAMAFGNQLNAREQQVIEAARELRNYDLTTNEEADLIERHGWLATLDRSSQIKAMRDLVQPLRTASQPVAAAPIKPRGVDMVELARAKHLTATTFIEPSSRGSSQETAAATGVDSALATKIAEYRKAMSLRPGDQGFEPDQYGANRNAERLLREINALQRRR